MKLGEHEIGNGHPVFITFEAGPTHTGLESALELIRHASKAGANAVKFQMTQPDRLIADREQMFSYDILHANGATETVEEPLYDIACRRALTNDEWRQVKAECDRLSLIFFATATFEDVLDFCVELGCLTVKVASADVTHLPLIRYAARTGMVIQLDTGNATIQEIAAAVGVIEAEGADIIIHHCPSGYPARLESINLRMIPEIKKLFSHPVGFSDHTPGRDMDIAAIAIGACLVEKTITLDRTARGPEHMFSLEPYEMRGFVRNIRDVETALGARSRPANPKRMAVRRSTFLVDPVKAGQVLRGTPVEFRRPGHGLAPNEWEPLLEAVFATDLPAGHRLSPSDLVLEVS